jgi:hypothetical protein
MAGRVAQVVECLPSKGEVLNSIPSTAKKKKAKKETKPKSHQWSVGHYTAIVTLLESYTIGRYPGIAELKEEKELILHIS